MTVVLAKRSDKPRARPRGRPHPTDNGDGADAGRSSMAPRQVPVPLRAARQGTQHSGTKLLSQPRHLIESRFMLRCRPLSISDTGVLLIGSEMKVRRGLSQRGNAQPILTRPRQTVAMLRSSGALSSRGLGKTATKGRATPDHVPSRRWTGAAVRTGRSQRDSDSRRLAPPARPARRSKQRRHRS
jgi:hypothetical protein